MTIEKASELVQAMPNGEHKYDLFAHFETLLNPHTFNEHKDNQDHANWCYMFAEMCGFGIARNIDISL